MPFSSLLCAGLIKIKLLKVLPSSPQIFNIPEYANSITFLDNLFQCFSTFMLKRFLLIPKQNFYCCWRDLLCLLLVLCISEKSLVMSCLYPTIRQLKIATRFRKGLRKPVSLILIHHGALSFIMVVLYWTCCSMSESFLSSVQNECSSSDVVWWVLNRQEESIPFTCWQLPCQ